MKSERNKTIDISIEDGKNYLERCLKITQKVSVDEILNKTLIGDSFEVMSKLPESFVDLLIVDPPYNLTKNFNGSVFRQTSNEEYEKFTEKWINDVKPLLKPTASVYVCCDWFSSLVLGPVIQRNFQLQNRITWQREKGRGAKSNWKNSMEDIWYATMSDEFVFNVDDVKIRRRVVAPYKVDGSPKDWEETDNGNFRNTCPSNFWDDISIPYWSMKENTAHPTQKSEKLLAKIILASSNKGDIVFDPFLGTGPTSVTAKKLGRTFVGIEQKQQYCIWAEKRLEMAESDKSIQGYSDGVFWERNTGKFQQKH